MKTGVENVFWSEIGSGFGEPGGTPPPRIPRNTPRGAVCNFKNNVQETYLFVSNLCLCHLQVNFFAYFKFHSD